MRVNEDIPKQTFSQFDFIWCLLTMHPVCCHMEQPESSVGKHSRQTEGQGSPTEFDLDVAVATVILAPVLFLCHACSFSLCCLIEALRIHADVVSWFLPLRVYIKH